MVLTREERKALRACSEKNQIEQEATVNPNVAKKKQHSKRGPMPCTSYQKGLEGAFRCSGHCGLSGPVWGGNSGLYTSDSVACLAARHAGVIPREGGDFMVSLVDGLEGYTGSERNGVTSLPYGRYDSSILISRPQSVSEYCCALCLYLL